MIRAGLGLALLLAAAGCDPPRRGGALPEYRTTSALPERADATIQVDVPAGEDPLRDLELTEKAKHYLLRYARLLCDNEPGAAAALVEPEEIRGVVAPVIFYVFAEDGRVAFRTRIDDPGLTLREKLDEAAHQVRGKAVRGYLHILVVSFTARLPNFGVKGLFEWRVYEPWVTGVAYEHDGRRAEIDPVQAMMANLDAQRVRAALCRELSLSPAAATELNELGIEIYRVVHFGEAYPSRGFVNFFRGHQVLTADQVTRELLDERLHWIGEWYKANVKDGEVQYEYSVSEQRYRNEKRTMVRSTMATWVLNRLAFHLGDEDLKRLGAQVIDHYLRDYFQIRRSLKAGRIDPSERVLPSGDEVKNRYTAASFIAAAILERDDWRAHRQVVDLLMAFAMGYRRPDGYLWTMFGQQQYFEPGQLLLGVAYAHGETGDPEYRRYFEELYGVYEKALTEAMHLGNGLYFPYAPAWFTQPAAEMYRQTGEARYRDFVYRINDRVARLYDLNARNQAYYDYDGMLLPKRDHFGNTSIVAACLESLVDAAIVAELDGDAARRDAYGRIIRRTVAFLLRSQFVPVNTYYIEHRERVLGGFKRDMIDTTSWMDNVWHLTSAFVKIQRAGLLEPASTPYNP